MTKKITMQDIADQLNISKNSVSQALTGKAGVSEKTRSLVEATARELGYEYLPARKNYQYNTDSKNVKIALIASDYAFSLKSFFGEIYLSIEKEIASQNNSLMIQSINQAAIQSLELPAFILNGSVDGVLILSHLNTEYIQKIISTGIPAVLVDHHHPHIKADAVLTNNRFGAFLAVEHLVQLGHREIGFIGNISISPSYYERLEGYHLALNHYGIKHNEALLLSDIEEDEDGVRKAMHQLPKQPTAWFCVNDGLGFLVSSYLVHAGYKIPEQISVSNFDNGQLSKLATPKITTMDIDLELFGKRAVEQLMWRISNKDAANQEILLPTTLLVRESTGPAPN
ncbi:LacI family DNA-binding transcriptional regulator [Niallia sp. MER 6]|uniref:LacI family DNA-binding transcriptional regulator n=1 Tax=Niallia sp. MER 6 TaxID=2939567 RepID=UPI00203ED9C9|nr:LacI family DNA-binding transcriptional regulator [Niallia sp. MER 6]MCM3031029.1 LacI family DNA-binding transcriptional regulator [Niallia sp. MER 6]